VLKDQLLTGQGHDPSCPWLAIKELRERITAHEERITAHEVRLSDLKAVK
jgi:hypothetical protein